MALVIDDAARQEIVDMLVVARPVGRKHVVEAAIFADDHDHVLDRRPARVLVPLLADGGNASTERDGAGTEEVIAGRFADLRDMLLPPEVMREDPAPPRASSPRHDTQAAHGNQARELLQGDKGFMTSRKMLPVMACVGDVRCSLILLIRVSIQRFA
jgi:hypothetical protein